MEFLREAKAKLFRGIRNLHEDPGEVGFKSLPTEVQEGLLSNDVDERVAAHVTLAGMEVEGLVQHGGLIEGYTADVLAQRDLSEKTVK